MMLPMAIQSHGTVLLPIAAIGLYRLTITLLGLARRGLTRTQASADLIAADRSDSASNKLGTRSGVDLAHR